MNDAVKSISLDGIDDLPQNPGMSGPGEKTRNKALQYTPQYGNLPTDALPPQQFNAEFTAQKSEGFSFTSTMTRFTEILGRGEGGEGMSRNQIISIVAVATLTLGGLFYFLGDGLFGTDEVATDESAHETAPPPERVVKEAAPTLVDTKPAAPEPTTAPVVEIPGNAYWKLPNPVAALTEVPTPISAQQVETMRGGLANPFTYQRFKAVSDMRKNKTEGSVAILYEALAQPKFWTRMEALITIAEHGIGIDSESMRAAIGDARSDLVRNYFRRFNKDYTDASAHMMREALRVVDGKARLIIMQNFANHRSDTSDMYLYAALQDSDVPTQSFAQQLLATHPASASVKEAYAKAMAATDVIATVPAVKRDSSHEIKVEQVPANTNVEEVYFINEEDTAPAEIEVAAPVAPAKATDDGFNALDHKHHEAEVVIDKAKADPAAAPAATPSAVPAK